MFFVELPSFFSLKILLKFQKISDLIITILIIIIVLIFFSHMKTSHSIHWAFCIHILGRNSVAAVLYHLFVAKLIQR